MLLEVSRLARLVSDLPIALSQDFIPVDIFIWITVELCNLQVLGWGHVEGHLSHWVIRLLMWTTKDWTARIASVVIVASICCEVGAVLNLVMGSDLPSNDGLLDWDLVWWATLSGFCIQVRRLVSHQLFIRYFFSNCIEIIFTNIPIIVL